MHMIRHDVVQQPLIMGDQNDHALGIAQAVDALGDDLEGIDVQPGVGLVENREGRLQHRHLEDLVALLLAAGEVLVHGAVQQLLPHLDHFRFLPHQVEKIDGVQLALAAMRADGVDGGFQQIDVVDPGDLHRILERHEHALARALLGRHGQQIFPLITDGAGRHFVTVAPGEDVGQRALAGAVGAHDRMRLPGPRLQTQALEDRLVLHPRMQVFYLQHARHRARPAQPTAPSSVTFMSFCASTANSIGNSRNTSLQKPLTIMFTASSSSSPRWRQ